MMFCAFCALGLQVPKSVYRRALPEVRLKWHLFRCGLLNLIALQCM